MGTKGKGKEITDERQGNGERGKYNGNKQVLRHKEKNTGDKR